VLTVKMVAKRLNCSTATIYELISSKRLRHYRIGTGRGGIRVSEDHIAEFLSEAEVGLIAPPSKAKLKRLAL
jgi:excisionase family DNA binding protein